MEPATYLLIAIASAMIGALIGGAVRWTEHRYAQAISITLQLHQEFHAREFVRQRIRAHALLGAAEGGMPGAFARATEEDQAALYAVLHFFERAAQLWRIGALHRRLLKRFFGQYARWWRPLLCAGGEAALTDPEWGTTLSEVDQFLARLSEG